MELCFLRCSEKIVTVALPKDDSIDNGLKSETFDSSPDILAGWIALSCTGVLYYTELYCIAVVLLLYCSASVINHGPDEASCVLKSSSSSDMSQVLRWGDAFSRGAGEWWFMLPSSISRSASPPPFPKEDHCLPQHIQ